MASIADSTQAFALRAEIAHCTASPFDYGAAAVEHFRDGLLVIEKGFIRACGPAEALMPQLPLDMLQIDYRGKLVVPGFIDTHTHYSQMDIIASYGETLLAWLERYAFPAETVFSNPEHAQTLADLFCDELLRHGTTSAMVFPTVHAHAVDAIFTAAQTRNMRLIAGRVLMDRNCPETLRDDPLIAHDETLGLIDRWHGRNRLSYAITPRFAPTSSRQAMTLAGELLENTPGLYLQSHLAENQDEVNWVAALYPEARSYLDVYARHRQLSARSVFAHCIWLNDSDRETLADTGSAISFCPSSNLFLGSGLFNLEGAVSKGVKVGLGTDIGAGTGLSMLRTLADAYKVLKLQGQTLTPEQGLYLATLGGAHSLNLDHCIGNFTSGKEADFVVIDPDAETVLSRRISKNRSLSEKLFALMMLGDDRCIFRTCVAGQWKHIRTSEPGSVDTVPDLKAGDSYGAQTRH